MKCTYPPAERRVLGANLQNWHQSDPQSRVLCRSSATYRSRYPTAQASTSLANRVLRVSAFLALHTQCSTTFW